jgi:hypothetical protein
MECPHREYVVLLQRGGDQILYHKGTGERAIVEGLAGGNTVELSFTVDGVGRLLSSNGDTLELNSVFKNCCALVCILVWVSRSDCLHVNWDST